MREDVLREVPGAGIASDQPYRVADLAVDFREDVPPLSPADIQRIVEIFERHGAHAKVSSIHVNGWFGDYDKLTTSRAMMQELFGIDLAAERGNYVFAGDSPNDAPMFGWFPNAVGVANVADFADRLATSAALDHRGPIGRGFRRTRRGAARGATIVNAPAVVADRSAGTRSGRRCRPGSTRRWRRAGPAFDR